MEGDSIWHSKHWSELNVTCDHPFPYSVFLKLPTIHHYNHTYLESWMTNFTVLVNRVRNQLPQVCV